jgi:Ca-activated chloride channel family protein
MGDFHFLRPIGLVTILPALILWWALWRKQDQIASWKQIVDPHLLEHLLVGEKGRRRLRPIHLLLVIWILSTVALSGPTWKREPSPFADDEAGLVVLLKVSGTMNAADVQPSRLERAKHKLRDLLELRKGSSTGLIVYSGSAHLVMPLTRDHRIISTMVEDLTPELMPEEGDVLAEAIELAESVFERAGAPGSILVLTDAVAPLQLQKLAESDVELPVQYLSLHSSSAPLDVGIKKAAEGTRASVVRLTVDPSDVEQLANRAKTKISSVNSEQMGDKWQDGGYFLLPFIALCALMWSRKGWMLT